MIPNYTNYPKKYYTALINDKGEIIDMTAGRDPEIMGVDLIKYNQLISEMQEQNEVLESYYNKLVELGEIVPEKTAEEIATEQQLEQRKINEQLIKANALLFEEIKKLSEKLEGGSENGIGNKNTGNSTKTGKKPSENV